MALEIRHHGLGIAAQEWKRNACMSARAATFNRETADPLLAELARMHEVLVMPTGLLRGHPFVAMVARRLHGRFHALPGTWIRDPRDAINQEDSIRSLLFRFVRPITPDTIDDAAVQKVIETVIKAKKITMSAG